MRIFCVVLLMLFTLPCLSQSVPAEDLPASPDGKGFVAPFVLMTPYEVNVLSSKDRSRYLGQVRQLLNRAPESWLLSAKNDCGRNMKQCEPSLFGEQVCISKRQSAKAQCSQKTNRSKDFSVQDWGQYYARLQKNCVKSKMPSLCQNLGQARLTSFN